MMTALENSTRLYEACLVSTVEEAQFTSIKCIRIYPKNYDPIDVSNFDFGEYIRSNNVTEKINAIEELYQKDKAVIEGTVITASSERTGNRFVDEKSLKENWMAKLSESFPEEMQGKVINPDSSLTFKIVDISPRGLVEIEFSEPVFLLKEMMSGTESILS